VGKKRSWIRERLLLVSDTGKQRMVFDVNALAIFLVKDHPGKRRQQS